MDESGNLQPAISCNVDDSVSVVVNGEGPYLQTGVERGTKRTGKTRGFEDGGEVVRQITVYLKNGEDETCLEYLFRKWVK